MPSDFESALVCAPRVLPPPLPSPPPGASQLHTHKPPSPAQPRCRHPASGRKMARGPFSGFRASQEDAIQGLWRGPNLKNGPRAIFRNMAQRPFSRKSLGGGHLLARNFFAKSFDVDYGKFGTAERGGQSPCPATLRGQQSRRLAQLRQQAACLTVAKRCEAQVRSSALAGADLARGSAQQISGQFRDFR